MQRLPLVGLGILASVTLFGTQGTQESIVAQIERVEGAQSPKRQGLSLFDP
jgi:hypothetical protein